MPYYVMTCDGEYPSAVIDHGPRMDDAPWFSGTLIQPDFNVPLVYVLKPKPGILKAMYAALGYPIMRDDLIDALQAAGVDNLQLFDAVVEDPVSGTRHTNYKAFNVVGAVAAADMAKSVLMGTPDSGKIDIDFESLAIDEKKAAPFKLFRLAESVSAIIVNDAVKDEVERRNIPGMEFYEPADWSG
jgi:uncharacterized protein DUF1629